MSPKAKAAPMGLGSSAVVTMDVQMADVQVAAVQSDLQPPSERVAYRAALLPPFPPW